MTFNIKHAESLSRGELLLRSFFGWIYIYFPHFFVLIFMGLWGAILGFIAWWMILFTGRYPQSFFEYQVGLQRWQMRVNARYFNLTDGYPAFGIDSKDEAITFDVPYPEKLSRGMLLVRAFFGWLYVLIPHGIVLYLLTLAVLVVWFVGWWIILFTGQLPAGMHNFIVGYMRWTTRVNLYMGNMTDTYPPFSLD
ncbi:MAG: DUF4389 domain-containing protein [Cyclobacteriaceae bacterium]